MNVMLEKEKNLLRAISDVSNVIRRKHRLIKTGREATEKNLSEFFKPVSEPLKKLTHSKDKVVPPTKSRGVVPRDYSTPRVITYDGEEPGASRMSADDDTRTPLPRSESMDSFKSVDDDYVSFDASRRERDASSQRHEAEIVPTEVAETRAEDTVQIEAPIERYLEQLREKNNEMDTITGVRILQSGLQIGDSPITFSSDKLKIGDKEFQATPGLLELMFKKNVDTYFVTDNDLEQYGAILDFTNALKKHYVRTNTMRKDHSSKFKNIISKLLKKSTSGRGLPKFLLEHRKPRNIDYIYWDDPNELVDRLRLLVSSQAAGNTNHSKEIFSIIEELRESGVIY